METYQGKAADLRLGTALNRGVKVEEDSMGREPEEGAGNGRSTIQSVHRKESLEGTAPAPGGLATPAGLKEQWDAQWQQFLKMMDAPKLKVGHSEAPAGTCHSWTVLATSEGACSVNPTQQREIVPQVPFGSSEEAQGPPDRTVGNRIVKQMCKSVREESVQFPQAKQPGLEPGRVPLLTNIKEEEDNYILIEDDEKAAVEAPQQTESPTEVESPRQSSRKRRHCLNQKFNGPEKRKANCPYPLRTYENRVKSKAFQTVLMQPQDPERWEPPTRRTFEEVSAQFPEAEPDGSEQAGQELLFDEIAQDGHCVLIGEDGKATVEELHPPEVVVELESSEQTFGEDQRGGGARSRLLNGPEKRKDISANALRTYEKRAKSKAFQNVAIRQQEPERWESPDAPRTLKEESAQFPEAEPDGSEQAGQERLFNEITQDGRCVLIGEDGKATIQEQHQTKTVIEVESSAEPFREAQPLNGPEKRKDKSANSLRTYEKRAKSKAFQTAAIRQQEPERWESPTCRTLEEESAQFPEAEPDRSEQARQERLFNEITQDGHCVLIGEDGKTTMQEQHRPETVSEVESSAEPSREAQPLNGPEKRKDRSANSLRTYEKRAKSKAFQTIAIRQQEPERWESPTCRTLEEESAQFPKTEPDGSEQAGQERLFNELTQDGHCVLIGEDGEANIEEQHRPGIVTEVELSAEPFRGVQPLNGPEKRKDRTSNGLRTYEKRAKSKAFQAAAIRQEEPERREPQTRRTFEEESAQFPEAEPDGSEQAGQERLFNEITRDGHCVLIGEDGKATVEELRPPEVAVELGSSGQTFGDGQRGGGAQSRPLNGPEKRKDRSANSLRTYEKRAKSKAFQTVAIRQQEPERWEPPMPRSVGEEPARFPEATQAGSAATQELLGTDIKQEENYVLIGEDGNTTVEELHPPEMVAEVESSGQSLGETCRADERSRTKPLHDPGKTKDPCPLRTYEKRVKSKAFQTVTIQQQKPERWDSPMPRSVGEESSQFPEAAQAGSEAGQELLGRDIKQEENYVLIGQDGNTTVEELHPPEMVVKVESSGQTLRETCRADERSRTKPLHDPGKTQDSCPLRTYEKRVKSKAFQTVAIQEQKPERWDSPMPRSVGEESAQFPEATQAGSEAGQELLGTDIKQEENYVLIGEDGKVTVEELRQPETVVKVESSGQTSGEARRANERSRSKPLNDPKKIRDPYPLRVKNKAFQAVASRQQEPEQWESPVTFWRIPRSVCEESTQFPEAMQAGSEAGQELLGRDIKQEENYVLIGEEDALEELHPPEMATEAGSSGWTFGEGRRGGAVSLPPELNGPEKRRGGRCSHSWRAQERKGKRDVLGRDLMQQREPERTGARGRRRFHEESVQFPERKQAGSASQQQLLFREIKQEENYVLIAGDGRAYVEQQRQPDSFIEVELSRQLFGEDQGDDDDEASSAPAYKKKAKRKFFPTEEDEPGESECRRMFRKELDLPTDEETPPGENPCQRSGFGDASLLSMAARRPRCRRKPHACSECGKSFLYRSILFAHRRVHRGEAPAQCSDCGKTFSRPEDLSAHQRRTHAAERPYRCLGCGKRFGLLLDLVDHKWVHAGENPYRSEEGRYARRRVHASQMPYVCSHCGKRFVKTRELVAHQKIHAGEKTHECSVCGRWFMYRTILLAHQRVHTQEKSYGCLECGKAFGVQRNLLTHQRRIHHAEEHAGSPSTRVKTSLTADGSKGS